MTKRQKLLTIEVGQLPSGKIRCKFYVGCGTADERRQACRCVLESLCEIVLILGVKGGVAGLFTAEEKSGMRRALDVTPDYPKPAAPEGKA